MACRAGCSEPRSKRGILPVNKTLPLNAASLLKQYGVHASKRLGQNFLQDPGALKMIAVAADIRETDTVLEIGAGLGSLTRYLASQAREVVAVELDEKLVPILQAVLKPYINTHIIAADILQLSPQELGLPSDYIVAANIPYNITSAIIRHLLESQPKPRSIVLTIQKEVAERICSSPPDMSVLALSVQVYGRPEIVAPIPASAFFPPPKVDSAIVRIGLYSDSIIPLLLLPLFFRLLKAGFGQKRKTLRNALSAGMKIPALKASELLDEAGIDPQRRAETLSLQEWKKLCEVWQSPLHPIVESDDV
jgi:16S rRNA (adenine1518-N6/adenine1519-N6)-dimethyltransferase